MKKVLLSISLLTTALAFGQTTHYAGNGKSSFGGAIGRGSFEITDKGDSVRFLLTKGPATFDSLLVFYVDGIAGGITTTLNLAAGTDAYSTAVTGKYSEQQKSVLSFSEGFQPDFSVVFNKDGGRIYFFEKDAQNNDVIFHGGDVALTPMGSNGSLTYSGTIAKADVSVSGPVNFKLIGTYIGEKASRSNEGFGDLFAAYDNSNIYASYTAGTYLNYSSTASLPVSLVDFNASIANEKVQIKWTVAQEINIDEYQIQRSTNGIDFLTIATIKAKNSSNSTNYTSIDENAATGTNYYRLIIKEKGRSEISKVISVKNSVSKRSFSIKQSGSILNMRLSNVEAGNYKLLILSSNGQLIQTETVQHNGGGATKQIVLKKDLVKGIYRIVLQSDKMKLTQSIML